MSGNRLQQCITMLFKAFDKPFDKEIAQIYYNRLSQIDISLVEKRILDLIDENRYFPRIAEIREGITKIRDENKTAELMSFMIRFRKQATSRYPFTKIDDDVYTVKRYIGAVRVENCLEVDWKWIEREAKDIYKTLKSGDLPMLKNPNEERVKVLPGGSRCLPKSKSPFSENQPHRLADALPGSGDMPPADFMTHVKKILGCGS